MWLVVFFLVVGLTDHGLHCFSLLNIYGNQEIEGYVESHLVSGRNYTRSAEVSDSTCKYIIPI